MFLMRSLYDWENIVVNVEASTSIGKNVECLGEPKLLLLVAIHAKMSHNEHKNWVWNGTLLNIRAHVGIFNLLERERLYFFWDLFESLMFCAGVGHSAAILIKVNELHPLFSVELHNLEVFSEEHLSNLLMIHFSNIFISWCR